MGPTALFDKSFLQSLNQDEAALFDNFFTSIICLMFFAETLADLEKVMRKKRNPEDEVRIIADKVPEVSGLPVIHHATMCLENLLGKPIPMTGQVPIRGRKVVKSEDKYGVVYDNSPEIDAFHRWQKREFSILERDFAKAWREALESIDSRAFA